MSHTFNQAVSQVAERGVKFDSFQGLSRALRSEQKRINKADVSAANKIRAKNGNSTS